ncbi:MAG: hypothetical protein JWN99_2189 [Ilumatobacteraceae bacterium]|nr:hypothetical protein [Ilumatobacteraceae bacterium]
MILSPLPRGGPTDHGHVMGAPAFGMCVDRFGTPWMISADTPTQ